jgi:transcriptional regulator with XRE-family HTH domain
MHPRTRKHLEELSPEQRAKVESALAKYRTPEQRTEEEKVRQTFEDSPSVGELVDRGEVDPERIMSGTAFDALQMVLSRLKRERVARGVSLQELAELSGIALATLSRLEGGKNPNPTFETLSRFAAALGLELRLDVVAPSEEAAEPSDAEAHSRLHRELQDVLGHSMLTRAHQVYRRTFSNLNEDDLQAWLTLEAEMTLRAVSSALASEKFRATVRSALKEAMVG